MNPKPSRIFVLVRLGLLFVLALFLLPACSKKQGEQTAGSTGDYVTGTPLPERQEGTSFLSGNVDRQQFQPIYFDFDSQTIRSSENGKIQQIASFLQQSNSQIIIAGFTDERGTPEYNRGLGERRAAIRPRSPHRARSQRAKHPDGELWRRNAGRSRIE